MRAQISVLQDSQREMQHQRMALLAQRKQNTAAKLAEVKCDGPPSPCNIA